MALNVTGRRAGLGPGDDASGDPKPADKSNVVPLARPRVQIEREGDELKTRPGGIVIRIEEDGLVELQIGGADPGDDDEDQDYIGGDFNRNLAEDLDDNALMALAAWLIEGVEADLEDRREWEETTNLAAYYLGIRLNDPITSPSNDGTICQMVSTAMMETATKLWASARAELLPVAGPVKVERVEIPHPPGIGHNGGPALSGEGTEPGQDPAPGEDAARDDLADALEKDMNWYLTRGDKGYYPDTRNMLMHRYWIGNAFKEVFRCPIERKPLSRWVMAQDLIISGNPAHLSSAKRVTKRARIDQGTMLRMMAVKYYRKVSLAQATGRTSNTEIVIGQIQGTNPTPSLPRDMDHEVYETNCNLGSGTSYDLLGTMAILDRDENGKKPGFPMPYRVAMDVDTRTVLSIRRNWKKGDEDYRPRPRFVKYGMVPGMGYYDLGLIHVVGNPAQAATMLQRSTVDAGVLANFPAWAMLQSSASRLENTTLRPGAGEVVKIPATGQSKITDVMMQWPYKDVSEGSLALVNKLEGDIRKQGGVIDIPVGEGRIGNTPVGTIMSYIESISMVPSAVHKDDHIAQQEEFEMLRELIAEEPEVLTRGNRSPARKWQIAEELLSPDLVPRADPNTPSQIHRLTKVQGLVALGGQQQFALGDKDGPIVNQRAIYRRAVEVLTGDDSAGFEIPANPQPQGAPPPDPKIVAAQISAEAKKDVIEGQLQGKKIDQQTKIATAASEAQQRTADRQSEERRSEMSLAGKKVESASDSAHKAADRSHDATQQALDRQHEATQNAAGHAHEAALTPPFGPPLSGDGSEPSGSSGA